MGWKWSDALLLNSFSHAWMTLLSPAKTHFQTSPKLANFSLKQKPGRPLVEVNEGKGKLFLQLAASSPLLMPDVLSKAECKFDLSLLCCKLTNYSDYTTKVIAHCKNTCLQTLPIQRETGGIAIKETQRLIFIAALKAKNATEWGHKPPLH